MKYIKKIMAEDEQALITQIKEAEGVFNKGKGGAE